MCVKTQENLTERQVEIGLKHIIADGIASQVMGILTGGAFLTAFAIKLGASNMIIGLLAAIGPLSQLLQLPSVILIEKIRNRRAIVKEEGEVEENIVARELYAEIKSQIRVFSSIEGLRQMISFPLAAIRDISRSIVSNDRRQKNQEYKFRGKDDRKTH
jgi:hypothetical protein